MWEFSNKSETYIHLEVINAIISSWNWIQKSWWQILIWTYHSFKCKFGEIYYYYMIGARYIKSKKN